MSHPLLRVGAGGKLTRGEDAKMYILRRPSTRASGVLTTALKW